MEGKQEFLILVKNDVLARTKGKEDGKRIPKGDRKETWRRTISLLHVVTRTVLAYARSNVKDNPATAVFGTHKNALGVLCMHSVELRYISSSIRVTILPPKRYEDEETGFVVAAPENESKEALDLLSPPASIIKVLLESILGKVSEGRIIREHITRMDESIEKKNPDCLQ